MKTREQLVKQTRLTVILGLVIVAVTYIFTLCVSLVKVGVEQSCESAQCVVNPVHTLIGICICVGFVIVFLTIKSFVWSVPAGTVVVYRNFARRICFADKPLFGKNPFFNTETLVVGEMVLDSINLDGALSRSAVSCDVLAKAKVRIGTDLESLKKAFDSYVGLSDEMIAEYIRELFIVHLRLVVGDMEVDDMQQDHVMLQTVVCEAVKADLARQGIVCESFEIESIESK